MDRAASRASLVFTVLTLVLLTAVAFAQEAATVTFTFDFPGSQPDHYVLAVSSSGRATYDSNGKLSPQSETGDPFRLDFTISDATRARVFDLARRAHYFDKDVDLKKKNLASTGIKTLKYEGQGRVTQATYNYSSISAVQELTNFFQSLSTTLEFGRRLEYYHHYQKLALDDELKRMEDMAKQNSLAELSAVAPVLQQIASDTSVINPVRARAQRLLAQAGDESRR